MAKVYLGLGSNVGERTKFLQAAIEALAAKITNLATSSIYETAPWGKTDQDEFLNLCISGETELTAEKLLEFIKQIEIDLGRVHGEKWGPREIDIDILLYDDLTVKTSQLEIPHPFIPERAFVLIPLAEIAPNLVHPVLKKTISELAKAVSPNGIKRLGQ